MELINEFINELFSGFASGDPKFIVSQIAALITAVLAVFCVQVNNPRHILYLQLAVNLTTIASHLFNGAGSGTAVVIVAVIHLACNCAFSLKGKTPPKFLLWLFAVPYIGSVIIGSERMMQFRYTEFGFWVDGLLIFAAICFMLAVSSKKASGYRFFILINTFLWIVYDFYGGVNPNVSMLVTHIVLQVSNIIAIVRLDILKKGEAKAATEED